ERGLVRLRPLCRRRPLELGGLREAPELLPILVPDPTRRRSGPSTGLCRACGGLRGAFTVPAVRARPVQAGLWVNRWNRGRSKRGRWNHGGAVALIAHEARRGSTLQTARHAIVITGASSGLGAALAVDYAGAGRTLGLIARNRGKLDDVAARCASRGARCV